MGARCLVPQPLLRSSTPMHKSCRIAVTLDGRRWMGHATSWPSRSLVCVFAQALPWVPPQHTVNCA